MNAWLQSRTLGIVLVRIVILEPSLQPNCTNFIRLGAGWQQLHSTPQGHELPRAQIMDAFVSAPISVYIDIWLLQLWTFGVDAPAYRERCSSLSFLLRSFGRRASNAHQFLSMQEGTPGNTTAM